MLSPLLGLACLLLHASAAISAGADPQSTSAPERGHHTFWAGKLALLLSAIFTGAALYISAAEHPARMGLTTEAAHAQWKPAYVRGFAMQASLAVFAGCAGLYSYYIRGELLWVAGALTILANWPYTLLIMMATNKRLMAKHTDAHTRNLLVRWGHFHLVRTSLGAAACGLFIAAL